MRRFMLPYQRFFVAILVGLAAAPMGAQSPFDPGMAEEAARIHEQLYIFTDRSVYTVDETIYFVADQVISGAPDELNWSSMLYLELIASDGEVLSHGKFSLSGGRAEGALHIPAESLTGSYYLRTYTRWMRNRGQASFSYMPLKIINPFRSELAGIPETHFPLDPPQKLNYKKGLLECSVASTDLQLSQETMLNLRIAPGAFIDQLQCCISVVPAGAIDLESGQYVNTDPGESEAFQLNFLPDLGEDISISGTVVGPDQEAVPYTTLHFSLLGAVPDYFAAMSDAHGKFVISIPAGQGKTKEFYVTPEQQEGSGLDVRIDQEYASRPAGISTEAFSLSDEESELAAKLALNMQLSRVFTAGNLPLEEPETESYTDADSVPFYGTSVIRLLIDDYVRLPNLEETFINLMPEVQVYKKKGENRIRILSDNNSIGVYNPLIMIDNISVFDHEALLALSPEKIERIDLINDIYLKGSVPFGGILSIYSRNGDMAGIDLPTGSYFFDYESSSSEQSRMDPLPVFEERVPDTRNTILWLPELLLQKGEQVEIPFRAPANPGSYQILVRTVSPDGEVFAASSEFTVE